MNCLKGGLIHADAITTVSPSYAREITDPKLGCGLDGVLLRRQEVLTGILNGVNYNEWKTSGNPHLKYPFTTERLAGKGQLAGRSFLSASGDEILGILATSGKAAGKK